MKGSKVGVIGTGFVGASYAFSLTLSGIVDELVLIDRDIEVAEGHAMDLNHCLSHLNPMRIYAGKYEDLVDADLIVLAAGVNQKEGETRLDLIDRNVSIFKSIVDQLPMDAFTGILLVATNPVDILSHITQKYSGLKKNRVIGSGTILDTARLRYLLGDRLDIDSRNIHGYIIGEHGDSELPVWSHTSVGSKPIEDLVQQGVINYEELNTIFDGVKNSAYEIINRKGSTYYGIAAGLMRITRAILRDERTIITVSALIEGEYGHEDVYIGVPAIVDRDGIREVVELSLAKGEQNAFSKSVNILKDILKAAQ